MGHNFSHRVLVGAAKGWFISARRDKKEGNAPDFYDAHGLSEQRAYQIVCLMVGSDPPKFRDLADETKLPIERRTSCQGDYRNAAWSWTTMLAPRLRGPDQPRQAIEINYAQAGGKLEVYAHMFRAMRLLETISRNAADRFLWPRPFTIEMRACGDAGARWDGKSEKIELCYEIVEELAQTYLAFGDAHKRREPAQKH
jgi:hypothetical protein